MALDLADLRATAFLEVDLRPTFIVSLASTSPHLTTSELVYANPALKAVLSQVDPRVKAPLVQQDGIQGHIIQEQHEQLWHWAESPPGLTPTSFSYLGLQWTRFIAKKWAVVTASIQPGDGPPVALPGSKRSNIGFSSNTLSPMTSPSILPLPSLPAIPSSALPVLPSSALRAEDGQRTQVPTPPPGEGETRALRRSTTEPDWIVPDFIPEQEPFLNVINSVDWAASPLGRPEQWPPRLHQALGQIVADSRPIAIYWGSSYTTIYNEAFSKICGCKHPWLLGKPVDAAWPEAGRRLKETMKSSAQKQRASAEDEWRFFVEKTDGVFEETYLKWSIIPVMENDQVQGFMHSVLETTSMRLWERRMKMLIELGEVLITARDVKSYWGKTIEELEAVEPRYDIPVAIIYSVEDDADAASDASGSYDSSKICRLEGSLGVPKGHPIIPETLVLRHSDEGLSSMFREALRRLHPVLLQTKDGTLPESLLKGLQYRGFGDACTAAVICPIRPTKEENTMGLLFLGLNPRRPYDNDYRQYISLLSQKLTTSLASTVLLEEEARRGMNAAQQAAFDQEALREKLAVQTKEATESIQKFEAVADFIPVGMCFGDSQGNITFANDAWYRITSLTQEPGGLVTRSGFMSCVVQEDRPNITHAYEQLQYVRSVTFEFRVKRQDSPEAASAPSARDSPSFEKAGLDLVGIDSLPPERHVLAEAKAERAIDGAIIRVLTCLTDVTLHKHTAEAAVRRAQQAENLKRMAEFATVGMYDMDLEGRLLGANHVFYEMCGLDQVDPATVVVKPWEKCVADQDLPVLKQSVAKMVKDGRSQTAEIRFKTPWTADDSAGHKVAATRWIEATFMPVKSSEGIIRSFTGCLSDLSLQKLQLERERQRKEQAIESKRQQENFIDMTSHEMRNPLGAIVHCSDAIVASLTKAQELSRLHVQDDPGSETNKKGASAADNEMLDKLIVDSIDTAETIVACAQHQRRIVDDILTMSKLDSNLLAITPITANPIQIVQEALKMFEIEARRVDINLSMVVDPSYLDLGVDYLDFDPSRIKQVLINLLTNALKFTVSGPTRNVSVTLGGSTSRPTDATSAVQYIPRSGEYHAELQQGGEPPSPAAPVVLGEPVYLIFEVKDTGQGLSEDEKNSLFQRFVQASSRTHVKYGGSGLGLFICRRLTELQDGAIGVASEPGIGSTFAFYIETHHPSALALKEAQAAVADAIAARAPTSPRLAQNDSTRFPWRSTALAGERYSSSAQGPPAEPPAAADETPPIMAVLVVEDNLINQQITRRQLLKEGFAVQVANHGEEALEKLGASARMVGAPPGAPPLSLILMDIEMPVQNGLTCTRLIRELERNGQIRGGRIPIIAVSANARTEQIGEARAAGCDDVLVKPYRIPELIEKMGVVAQRLWREGEGGGVDGESGGGQ